MAAGVALVGTCQVVGIGPALQKLLPDTPVKLWHITSSTSPEAIAEQLIGYDVVFSQVTEPSSHPLQAERLKAKNGHVILLPPVVFSGFHPDCIYLLRSGQILNSPFGPYHSAICVAGFLLGQSPAATTKLFNAFVQGSLNYFQAFGHASRALIDNYAAVDIDLTPHISEWLQGGSFMHTPNHPSICVLSTVAMLAARRAGLIDADITPPHDVADFLGAMVWPVYPAIAQRLGIKGSMTIVLAHDNETHAVSMDRFVHECHILYQSIPRDVLETPHVAGICQKLSKLMKL